MKYICKSSERVGEVIFTMNRESRGVTRRGSAGGENSTEVMWLDTADHSEQN